MFVLRGFIRRSNEILEQEFSLKELDLAISIGQSWFKDGLNPVLYSKTYNGKFVFYNHVLRANRRAA